MTKEIDQISRLQKEIKQEINKLHKEKKKLVEKNREQEWKIKEQKRTIKDLKVENWHLITANAELKDKIEHLQDSPYRRLRA